MVHTQAEAKAFFVERVIQRATTEGVSLSAAERWMLRFWSATTGQDTERQDPS
jgi:hypothetical protein